MPSCLLRGDNVGDGFGLCGSGHAVERLSGCLGGGRGAIDSCQPWVGSFIGHRPNIVVRFQAVDGETDADILSQCHRVGGSDGEFQLFLFREGLGRVVYGLLSLRFNGLGAVGLEAWETAVALYFDGELCDALIEDILIAVAEVIDAITAVVFMEAAQFLHILAESKETFLDDGPFNELDFGLNGTEVLLRPHPFFKVIIIFACSAPITLSLYHDFPAIDILPPFGTVTGEDATDIGFRHARLDDGGDAIGQADIEHALAGEQHLLGEYLKSRLVLGSLHLMDELATYAHGLVVGTGGSYTSWTGGRAMVICSDCAHSRPDN